MSARPTRTPPIVRTIMELRSVSIWLAPVLLSPGPGLFHSSHRLLVQNFLQGSSAHDDGPSKLWDAGGCAICKDSRTRSQIGKAPSLVPSSKKLSWTRTCMPHVFLYSVLYLPQALPTVDASGDIRLDHRPERFGQASSIRKEPVREEISCESSV
jgi:hypothetical protein